MKKINIQNEANIGAKGVHTSKNAKPVICLENGNVFASMLDAADYAGVTQSTMVVHLQGKTRSCAGKHFCYLSRVNESLDTIVTRLRETSAMEDDAKKWREYQAEQEAIRKAEEKRLEEERKAEEKKQAEIASAKAKVARLTEAAEKYQALFNKTMNDLVAAEQHLESLVGDENNDKEIAA